jgi:hypothetical protein
MPKIKYIIFFIFALTAVYYAQTPQGMIAAPRSDVIAAWGGGYYSNNKEIDYIFGTTGMRVYFNSRDHVNKIVMVQWETESPFRNNVDSLVNLSDSKVESITFSIA